MKFIGREEQLKRLDRVINTDELTFSLIYGRRRVGKSAPAFITLFRIFAKRNFHCRFFFYNHIINTLPIRLNDTKCSTDYI